MKVFVVIPPLHPDEAHASRHHGPLEPHDGSTVLHTPLRTGADDAHDAPVPAEVGRMIATALMIAKFDDTQVTLMLPLESAAFTLRIQYELALANGGITLRIYDLPSLGKDMDALDQARSLVYTRLLQDLGSDLILVFEDPSLSRLRCASALGGSLLAYIEPLGQVTNAETAYRGIKPAYFTSAQTGNGAMIDTAAARSLLNQVASNRLTGVQHLSDQSYAGMIAALKKLKRPAVERLGWSRAIAYNEGRAQPRQLLLDVSVIVHGDARSGIQRVVRSLFNELLRQPPQGMEVRLIHFLGGAYRYANVFARTRQPTPHFELEDTLVDFRQDDVYLALDLNSHLVEPAAKAFMDMKARGVQMNFVVYDILLIHHPEWWAPGTSEAFEKWLRSISTLADRLVCISQAVADDVLQWINTQDLPRLGKPQVASFHLGADVAGSAPSTGVPTDAAPTLAALAQSPSFLMVGTVEPRKGHAQALAAFELLWEQGAEWNLVIVGKAGWLVDDLAASMKAHPQRGRRLFWLEGISDEYLEQIYQACACLLAPSLGEGFGLPLIEAAQHGLPIIARDMPVFREVAGEHVFYFDGTSADALAATVSQWVALSASGQAPDSRRIRFLNWKECAIQLQAVLGLQPLAERSVA